MHAHVGRHFDPCDPVVGSVADRGLVVNARHGAGLSVPSLEGSHGGVGEGRHDFEHRVAVGPSNAKGRLLRSVGRVVERGLDRTPAPGQVHGPSGAVHASGRLVLASLAEDRVVGVLAVTGLAHHHPFVPLDRFVRVARTVHDPRTVHDRSLSKERQGRYKPHCLQATPFTMLSIRERSVGGPTGAMHRLRLVS